MNTQMHELRIRSRLIVPFPAAVIRHLYILIPVRVSGYPVYHPPCPVLHRGPAFFSTVLVSGVLCRDNIERPRIGVAQHLEYAQGSKSESDEGNAGDKQAHRCEGGEVTNKISHNMAPFPLCIHFVLFLFSRQSLLSTPPAFHRAWLTASTKSV
ncbi:MULTISPECIES: hypothetical protein [Ensifer]|uniref:hypothetical protein n=1 Tax=Ensifer TaxID=106591 RepID=UPI00138DE113|nr:MULTISPECIES: hypothetical protein [Ensifer]MBD9486503.1 hypothetical protein [Ensifer sp. ENS11]UBI77636.1 hypothetical protein J3R84_05095 [Ensifer canadensis]